MHHQLPQIQSGTKLLELRLEEPLELPLCARTPHPAKKLVHPAGAFYPQNCCQQEEEGIMRYTAVLWRTESLHQDCCAS